MSGRKKPGPKPAPIVLLEGRDYYCGTCVGFREVVCDYCVDGCEECDGSGKVTCPQCNGGTIPVPTPRDR